VVGGFINSKSTATQNSSFAFLRLLYLLPVHPTVSSQTDMTSSSSVTEITSVEQFQQFIKAAGPSQVVALNFWAPWAAPCEQMNKVFAELSQKYPSVAFAQVYQISSLPSLIITD
jgi:thiol-disulfide isomerase/thioredoxin